MASNFVAEPSRQAAGQPPSRRAAEPPSRAAEPPSRLTPGLVARTAVTALLLAIVFRGVALGEVGAAVRGANPWLVLAAFAMNWSGILFSIARWRILLRAQGGDATYPTLARSFLVGQCFNNLLPSTIGGDAVRAFDTARFGVSRGAAVTTILVDRLLGLVALGMFALVSATVLAQPAISTPLLALALLAAAAVVGAGAWVILAPPAMVVAVLARLPVAIRRQIQVLARQLGDALIRFHRNPGAIARGLAISIMLQVGVIVFYELLGAALGFDIPAAHWFLMVPVAVLAMLAPISVNAIGVREGVFAFLLASYGVPTAGAVAFAWLAYASVALQAVLGALIYLGRARRGDRPRRLSAGVPAVEAVGAVEAVSAVGGAERSGNAEVR